MNSVEMIPVGLIGSTVTLLLGLVVTVVLDVAFNDIVFRHLLRDLGRFIATLAFLTIAGFIAAILLFPLVSHAQCPGFAGCAQNGAHPDGTVRPETFAQQPLRLYDAQGRFRGTDSPNPYQPDSLANSFSPYGNRFSPVSPFNEYGSGNSFFGNDSYLRREQGEE